MIRGSIRYGDRVPGCRHAAGYLLRAAWVLQVTPEDRLAYVDVLWEMSRMARDYLHVHKDDPSSPLKDSMRVLASELWWTGSAALSEVTPFREEADCVRLMAEH